MYPCWPSVERTRHVDPIKQNRYCSYMNTLPFPFGALSGQYHKREWSFKHTVREKAAEESSATFPVQKQT